MTEKLYQLKNLQWLYPRGKRKPGCLFDKTNLNAGSICGSVCTLGELNRKSYAGLSEEDAAMRNKCLACHAKRKVLLRLEQRNAPKPETNRRRLGEWHVRIWRGDDENDGSATTWPVPAGDFWAGLRDRLTTGCHHPDAVKLTAEDFQALRSIIHAYGQAIDKPRWLLDELVEALADAEKEEKPW